MFTKEVIDICVWLNYVYSFFGFVFYHTVYNGGFQQQNVQLTIFFVM